MHIEKDILYLVEYILVCLVLLMSKDMIGLLQQANFDPTNVDTDLHKRVS